MTLCLLIKKQKDIHWIWIALMLKFRFQLPGVLWPVLIIPAGMKLRQEVVHQLRVQWTVLWFSGQSGLQYETQYQQNWWAFSLLFPSIQLPHCIVVFSYMRLSTRQEKLNEKMFLLAYDVFNKIQAEKSMSTGIHEKNSSQHENYGNSER